MVALKQQNVIIASAGTVSGQADGTNGAAYGVAIPAAFTGTAISFQVSANSSTFQALYEYDPVANTGATRAVSLEVVQGRSYPLPDALTSWRLFKIVSNAAEGAARTLVISGKAP